MKIFISHSHQNSASAEKLVTMLLSNLSFKDSDIRCTSVSGHMLKFGKNIAELLKDDINEAPALIALISKESLTSDWVMFELGAAWGLNRTTIYPILGPNVELKDLPGPLGHLAYIEIESSNAASRISDLVQQLADDLELTIKNGGKAQSTLNDFLHQYKLPNQGKTDKTHKIKDKERQEDIILQTIWKLDDIDFKNNGYSVKTISEKASLPISMSIHFLDTLATNGFIEEKRFINADNTYLLTKKGRSYIAEYSV